VTVSDFHTTCAEYDSSLPFEHNRNFIIKISLCFSFSLSSTCDCLCFKFYSNQEIEIEIVLILEHQLPLLLKARPFLFPLFFFIKKAKIVQKFHPYLTQRSIDIFYNSKFLKHVLNLKDLTTYLF
jgi:hypothetical protein